MKKILLTILILGIGSLGYIANQYRQPLKSGGVDSGVYKTFQGGTGTGVKPTLGQVLVGQSDSTYLPVSTSTLGISQWITSGSNIYYSAGNVGVGTTSPSNKLEVNGNVFISGSITPTVDLAITNGGTNASSQATNGVNFFNGTSITSTSTFTYSNGMMTIGSISGPLGTLNLRANNNWEFFNLINSSNTSGLQGYGWSFDNNRLTFQGLTDGGLFQSNQAAIWKTNGLFNVGYGIVTGLTVPGGNTPPSNITPLDSYTTSSSTGIMWGAMIRNPNNGATIGYGSGILLGNSGIGGNETNKVAGIAGVGESNFSNSIGLAFYTNSTNSASSTEKVRITGTGKVGIGTTTPSSSLTIVGTTTISSGASYVGQAVCYLANGDLGHQTLAQLTAGTCVSN